MSTEQNAPEDIVRDGVESGTKLVPREPAGNAEPAGQADRPADAGRVQEGSTGDGQAKDQGGDERATKAPGPAEEKDSESRDDRGLTTDASPSD